MEKLSERKNSEKSEKNQWKLFLDSFLRITLRDLINFCEIKRLILLMCPKMEQHIGLILFLAPEESGRL